MTLLFAKVTHLFAKVLQGFFSRKYAFIRESDAFIRESFAGFLAKVSRYSRKLRVLSRKFRAVFLNIENELNDLFWQLLIFFLKISLKIHSVITSYNRVPFHHFYFGFRG